MTLIGPHLGQSTSIERCGVATEATGEDCCAPPRLLSIAPFVAMENRLMVPYAVHSLYTVFLDRGVFHSIRALCALASPSAVVGQAETPEAIRVVYAFLHLASVPGREPMQP